MSTPRVLTIPERAAAILRDPEQKVVHETVAIPLAALIERLNPANRDAAELARLIVHVEHEATYTPQQ